MRERHPYARITWTADRARAFIRLWGTGAGNAAIAEAMGLLPDQVPLVASRLRGWGHYLPHRHGGRRPWTPERLAPVTDAITRGVDDVDLAAMMGVAHKSVAPTLSRLRREGHAIPCRLSR